MENVKFNHILLYLTLNMKYILFFLFLIFIQIKGLFSEYFDSFKLNILNEDASLIDISDYCNLFPIITTDKKIYIGIPPIEKTLSYSQIISISSAASINNNYILISCSHNYLLSKINIETGEEEPLVSYENFKIPNCICSLSFKDNFAYIGISHIVIPTIKYKKQLNNNENKDENNEILLNSNSIETESFPSDLNYSISDIFNDINTEEEYSIFYDYDNKYLEHNVIKIKLKNIDKNPIIDETFNMLVYTFEYKHKKLEKIPFERPFSCEAINIETEEESRLVCGYVIANETDKDKYSYLINITVMNSDFNKIENEEIVSELSSMPYIRLQRIDNNSIIYFISQNSYIIKLKREGTKCIIQISENNANFYKFKSNNDLFFYNNNYLFSATLSSIPAMYIKYSSSENYIKAQDNINIKKIIGYYKKEGDILIFIYEYSSNKIKYFFVENMSPQFNIKSKSRVIEVQSNSSVIFNVTNLIVSPTEHELLSNSSISYYISITSHITKYDDDKYYFDKENQILTLEPTLNDWVVFHFYFEGKTNGIITGLYLPSAQVTIRTCPFKCGSCINSIEDCDIGACRLNFTYFEDKIEEGCFDKEQNFPNYIYNETNKIFQLCYYKCKFCSLISEFSSSFFHNCIVCEDGYIRSYTFPGNCYKYENPQNFSNYSIIVRQSDDESFIEVDFCTGSKKYRINDTGECVDTCPQDSVYYTYFRNNSVNLTKQKESFIGILHNLDKEEIPKYLFNKVCYSSCPNYTYEDKNNSICKCNYGWHYNSTTEETICYDNMDYCLSLNYYFHTDDKECVLNGCKKDYYQMNFECYKDKCPQNTKQISSNDKKCESILKYCIIDEHYQNQCGNSPYIGYNLRYNETKTYFQSCNESLYYFNIKTYLYKNICYEYCPEETTKNETDNRCSCKYYIYYVNEEKTDYECLNETEKCRNNKRYNITEEKECVNTKEECIERGYKVFNDECLLECPKNTKEKNDSGICICENYYYNNNDFLICLEDGKTCQSEGYPIKMSISSECFQTKNECIEKGFKFFNNICYENSCPSNTTDKNNDGICLCLYYYLNNSDILTCFEEGITCEVYGTQNYPYTNIDTKECFSSLELCIERGLKIFNNNCYSSCPKNTNSKKGESSCKCSYYFHTKEKNMLNCFNSSQTCESQNYLYTYIETNECFSNKEECIDKGYKIFNNKCYNSCPKNTEENDDHICYCSVYSLFDENNLINCFESEINCSSQDYYFNKETKECFISIDSCINNNKKIFGKECLDNCPKNSQIKNNPYICQCSYYYYDNNGIVQCFDEEKTCESEGYEFKSNFSKECFKSYNDCLSKNYLYFSDKICYKNNCPSGKIPLNIFEYKNKTAIIKELKLDNSIAEHICICDTENTYKGWIIPEFNPSSQKCLNKCPFEFDLDPTTHRCFYSCDLNKEYIFNNECYKNHCPEGTILKDKDPNSKSRICICEDITEVDADTGAISCNYSYPNLFYEDRKNCPYLYKNNCISECPIDTCLTTSTKELYRCIDKYSNMKSYNGVCLELIKEYAENLEFIENDDIIVPIVTPSGVIISAFSLDSSMEELIDKYPNITFVDLGECKDRIIEEYNFPKNVKLFIIGVDIPDIFGNSSINVYNYEIYLKNGTQIENTSACDDVKIFLSSQIKDLEEIKFNKAIDFYEENGYDIYNRTDVFYMDPCAPAHEKGNDISLNDRYKDFFPNISICNEGCIYKNVDLKNQRFICKCNANLSQKIYNYNGEDIEYAEGGDETYGQYFLSLINYKIFKCVNLFFEFRSFYSNAGFYISFITLIICLVLFSIFWINGIKYIRLVMYKNIPSEEKLNQIIKKHKRKRNKKIKTYNWNNTNKNSNTLENNKVMNINIKPHINIFVTNDHLDNNNKSISYNINDSPINNYEILKKSMLLNDSDLLDNKEKIVEAYNAYKKKKRFSSKRKKISQKLLFNNKSKKSTNENLINFYADYEKNKSNNQNKINEKESKINIYNLDKFINDNDNNGKKQKIEKNPPFIAENDSKEIIISKKSKRSSIIKGSSYKNSRNRVKFDLIEKKKSSEFYSVDLIKKKEKNEDLEIDFDFPHLIDNTDDKIDKKEFNNIPYKQALRIDNRSFIQIFISIFVNEIDMLKLFFYREPYSHFSLDVSIYLFELLLDLTMNCFLYTDDVVSEKYHNNGQLSMITSFSLSLISNIISSIIIFIISKLTNYTNIIEEIIKSVKNRRKYFENIIRLLKYIKIRLGIFYFLQLNSILLMTYYLFIFCTVYHNSQGSIMINYIIGACTSLAISIGLAIIITLLRVISIKYHYVVVFNISKYLYDHF